MTSKPVYFANATALRRWFAKHAATATELVVGFMKKGAGVPSVTWPEAVDEALCVGWIDGIRRSIDDKRYSNRFSPRKRGSHWSDINVRRVAALKAAGRMKPAGLAAFAGRNPARSGGEWYTQRMTVKLSPAQIKEIRRNAAAWKYYGALPPGYLKMAHWWIASAKQAETRARRLRKLIEACAERRRLY
ncbi:MAG: YdeI/OmpD-associated family protein [Steroidobacteraceae bacterium]